MKKFNQGGFDGPGRFGSAEDRHDFDRRADMFNRGLDIPLPSQIDAPPERMDFPGDSVVMYGGIDQMEPALFHSNVHDRMRNIHGREIDVGNDFDNRVEAFRRGEDFARNIFTDSNFGE